jgi:hypothetical protein
MNIKKIIHLNNIETALTKPKTYCRLCTTSW